MKDILIGASIGAGVVITALLLLHPSALFTFIHQLTNF
jgi:hypothetical protein